MPLSLVSNGLDEILVKRLRLKTAPLEISDWRELVDRVRNPDHEVTIAVVGKYMKHRDAYKSVYESLDHAGIAHRAMVRVLQVEAEELSGQGIEAVLAGVDGVLVPGGFGMRGIEGKIEAIRYARTRGIPFFGICLGMQCAAIEFARSVLGLEDANSTEFDKTTQNPVIALMEDQAAVRKRGGTMRLGAWPCELSPESRARQAYDTDAIGERHRHRYEFNNAYRKRFEDHGLIATGSSPDGALVEIIELIDHPWFLAVQFHPEFKSKPTRAHPLFRDFVAAALARREAGRADHETR
ncbi:MAG: CTP synthase [Singulisphaera sp.]